MVSMISENIARTHHDLKILGHRCSILGHFRSFCEILGFLGQKPNSRFFLVFLGPLGGLLHNYLRAHFQNQTIHNVVGRMACSTEELVFIFPAYQCFCFSFIEDISSFFPVSYTATSKTNNLPLQSKHTFIYIVCMSASITTPLY